MVKVDCLETKYKFTTAGRAYYEAEYKTTIDIYGPSLAHTFFVEIFKRVKDEEINDFLKQVQKTLYCRVYNFLWDVECDVLQILRNKRKLRREDQTHLLTIGLFHYFKLELYTVIEGATNKLYVEDDS